MKRRGTSQSCRKASSDSSEPAVRERSKRSIAAKRATVRQPARCAGDAHRDRTLRSSSAVISTLAAGGRSMPLSHARPTRTRGLRSLPRLPGPAARPAGATARRAEERRAGKGGVRTCRSQFAQNLLNNKSTEKTYQQHKKHNANTCVIQIG